MVRKIIKIDEEKCNGCGLCASACHEGAIEMVNGKAKLMSESYCDGLGACLPACPADAIRLEEREASAFDEDAVKARMEQAPRNQHEHHHGCPGTQAKIIRSEEAQPEKLPCGCPGTHSKLLHHDAGGCAHEAGEAAEAPSMLRQWPVQIKLIPVSAPYLHNANLLVAADCTAYAYANFHQKFMRNKITVIGCPKLDEGDYAQKLTEILSRNEIKSVTVVRMEVPCCGGIEGAVKTALKNSGKLIPWSVVTIATDGSILDE